MNWNDKSHDYFQVCPKCDGDVKDWIFYGWEFKCNNGQCNFVGTGKDLRIKHVYYKMPEVERIEYEDNNG